MFCKYLLTINYHFYFTALLYLNGSGHLIRKIQITREIECVPELWIFPFDIHLCKIVLKFDKTVSETPIWNIDEIVAINTARTLTKFQASSLRIEYDRKSPNIVKICLIFSRNFYSYLLTIYCPCMISILIGQISVISFPLTDFTTKITVVISLVIVVSTLFAQISSGFPNTAEIKIVEIFFFYCIGRLFTIFCLHAFIGYVQETNKKLNPVKSSTSKVSKLSKTTKWQTNYCSKIYNKSILRRIKCNLSLRRLNKIMFLIGFLIDSIFLVFHIFYVFSFQNSIIRKFESFKSSAY